MGRKLYIYVNGGYCKPRYTAYYRCNDIMYSRDCWKLPENCDKRWQQHEYSNDFISHRHIYAMNRFSSEESLVETLTYLIRVASYIEERGKTPTRRQQNKVISAVRHGNRYSHRAIRGGSQAVRGKKKDMLQPKLDELDCTRHSAWGELRRSNFQIGNVDLSSLSAAPLVQLFISTMLSLTGTKK
jgi:hypothetical protein